MSVSSRYISIHALRKESDAEFPTIADKPYNISIHALRKESDCSRFLVGAGNGDFNPRSP